jgi:uncharacterized protein YdaU (DUF1376 family)
VTDHATSLRWFPREPAKELARTAGLSPEAHAAYTRLRDQAWLAHNHGRRPCSIPADDASLARLAGMSGAQWRRVAEAVLPFFNRVADLYVDADLARTWEEQLRKYNKRANAGGKGGKAKALKQQSAGNATALRKHQERSSSLREEHYVPDALATSSPRVGTELPIDTAPRMGTGPVRMTDILRAAGVPRPAGLAVAMPAREDVSQ